MPGDVFSESESRYTWEDADEQCNKILELCEEIQERDLPADAGDFASSVAENVEDMQGTITEREGVTARQRNALDNMDGGCNRWLQSDD